MSYNVTHNGPHFLSYSIVCVWAAACGRRMLRAQAPTCSHAAFSLVYWQLSNTGSGITSALPVSNCRVRLRLQQFQLQPLG